MQQWGNGWPCGEKPSLVFDIDLMIMGNHEYPTLEELDTIEEWDFKDFDGLANYIGDLWHHKDWGYSYEGKSTKRLQLHTGGWSGNESIIDALQKNGMFWGLTWQKSVRGGHFWFKWKALDFTESK